MATYHGIVKAECLVCGYVTEDDSTLEMWNDLGAACPRCNMEAGFCRWTMEDGTVTLVEFIDGDPVAWYHKERPTEVQREGNADDGDPLCKECGNKIHNDHRAGYGMCGLCLHDALRSGWTPGEEE